MNPNQKTFVEPETQDTIFSPTFILVSLINLLIMVAYYLLFVISSSYAVERFSASPSVAGLVAGLMVIGCLAGRFITGHFITILGCRKVLLIGLAIYCLGLGLYFIRLGLPLLIVARLISGFGVGFIGTVTGATVALIVPPNKCGLGISYFTLSTIVALALGPFLGLTLLRVTSYTVIFILCLSVGLTSLALTRFLSLPRLTPPKNAPGSLFALSNYIEGPVVPFSCLVMLVCAGWGNIQAFISFHAQALGLMGAASWFFVVYGVSVFLTRPFTGRIFDLRGENVIIYPALALMALGLLLFSRADSAPGLLLAGALIGIGFGNFQSTAQATALKLTTRDRFGQATSTFFIFLDCGIGLAPYFFGFLVPTTGYSGIYLVSAGVAALGIPLYYLAHGRKKSRTGNQPIRPDSTLTP